MPIIKGVDEKELEETKQVSKESTNDYVETSESDDSYEPDYSANDSDEDFTSSTSSDSE